LLLQNINVLVLVSKHQCFGFKTSMFCVLVSKHQCFGFGFKTSLFCVLFSKHQCFGFGEEIGEVTKAAAQCQEPKICLRNSLSNIYLSSLFPKSILC